MKSPLRSVTVAVSAVSMFATGASSAMASYQAGDVRFRWAVPEATAQSGSGDVYFQINAPTSHSWAALGTGVQMRGSSMYIVYADGNGNVTLSTRAGVGHVMPQFEEDLGIQLIEGSGVIQDRMVANIRCSNCNSLDMTGPNLWIAGWRPGEPLDTSNMDARLDRHEGVTGFSVDFSRASVAAEGNPFLDLSNDDDDGNGNNNSGGGVSTVSEPRDFGSAHGIIMMVTFVILYPIGAMIMPLLGRWLIHSGMQLVAYALMWVGFALGYITARNRNEFFTQAHTAMGTVAVALLGLQPIFGWFHHRHFVKHKRRGIISHIHIWYGRCLIIVGIVNGGLGLRLSGSAPGSDLTITYAVLAAFFFVVYIAVLGYSIYRKRRSELSRKTSSEAGIQMDSPTHR